MDPTPQTSAAAPPPATPNSADRPPQAGKKAGWLSWLRRKLTWRKVGVLAGLLVIGLIGGIAIWLHFCYAVAEVMAIRVKEFSNAEYPEDPANRSVHFGAYSGRKLKLVRKDPSHFDFILEPTNEHTATVIFRDIDVSLMTPSEPAWTK